MSDAVIVALITLAGTILTVFITSKSTQDKMTNELKTQNAVQNQKIDQLSSDIVTVKAELVDKINTSRAVTDLKVDQLTHYQQKMSEDIKEHNSYAKQLPEIQGKLDVITEKQEVANKRINDLETFQKDITNRLINKLNS